MKRLILVVLGASVVAGLGAYIHVSKRPEIKSSENGSELPPASSEPAQPEPRLQTNLEPATPQPPGLGAATPLTQTAKAPSIRLGEPAAALEAAALNRTVDLLTSPLVSFGQKREAWHELRKSGRLDLAITELEQRTASDPQIAAYPAALAQAYLQKCAVTDDMREKGILAMQADKLFEQALNLDPSNWEARFTRAVAMSYWPPVLNKSDEVIQNFQTLIQQQETQAPQPHFAETYAWLGDQYQKLGRAEDAQAVWQRGAALFPDDVNLRKKLAPAPAAAQ